MGYLKSKIRKFLGVEKKDWFDDALGANNLTLSDLGLSIKQRNPYAGDNIINSYKNEVWVYACVREIAENIAGLPVVVKSKTTDKTVKDSKLINLFKKPNQLSNKFDFFNFVLSFLELRGECFVIKTNFDYKTKMPTGLMIKDPLSMTYEMNKAGTEISKWIYTFYTENGTEKQIKINPEDVSFFRYFNPFHEIRGMSPLEASRLSLLEAYQSRQYNINFFQNDASLSGILETEGTLSEHIFKHLEKQIKEKYSGAENSGKTMILEGGLKYKPVSISQKDMQYLETRKITREEICTIFRVPPPIVGIFEYASYANSEQAYISFWTKTLLPKLLFLQDVLNKDFFDLYEPENYMMFDITGVPVLQNLLSQKIDIAVKMFSIGYPLDLIDDKLNIDFLRDYTNQAPGSEPKGLDNFIVDIGKDISELPATNITSFVKIFSDGVNNFYSKNNNCLPIELVFNVKDTLNSKKELFEELKGRFTKIVYSVQEKYIGIYPNLKFLDSNRLNILQNKYIVDVIGKFFEIGENLNLFILESVEGGYKSHSVVSLVEEKIAKEENVLLETYLPKIEKSLIFSIIYYILKTNGVKECAWHVADRKTCLFTHSDVHNKEFDLSEIKVNGVDYPVENFELFDENCKCILKPKNYF